MSTHRATGIASLDDAKKTVRTSSVAPWLLTGIDPALLYQAYWNMQASEPLQQDVEQSQKQLVEL